jgi:hypothetical protein
LPQTLVLFKKLPYPDYLTDLQSREVYRAVMRFLPGGCYAGAALFDASPMYAMSGDVTSGDGSSGTPTAMTTTTTSTSTIAATCPYPDDPAQCKIWEIMEIVRKVSPTKPLAYNSFAVLEVVPGSISRFMEHVLEVSGDDDGTTNYVERDTGLEYVAAGRLIGCGTENVVLEVLADSHDRMLEILHACTDSELVRQFSVCRLARSGAVGFGESNAAGSAGIAQ